MSVRLKGMKYIMDASAVISVINNEPHIPELPFMFVDAIISTINLAEALTVIVRILNVEVDLIWSELSNVVPHHYPIDDELTYEVVKMAHVAKKYGLSMGDRYCLALARKLQLPIYTGDRIWKQLETQLDVSINLIR